MTPAAPESPSPAEHESIAARVRDWLEKDIEPRLSVVEADLAKVKGLGPEFQALAGIVEKIIDAAEPSAAPEVAALAADAGKVAARIAAIVAELGVTGL
jgi:hypothetical protein